MLMKRRSLFLVLIITAVLSLGGFAVADNELPLLAGNVLGGETSAEPADTGESDADIFLAAIPDWSGEPYCEVNGNVPDFAEEEIWTSTQESLDPLDGLGRCGTANSCIGLDGMPDKPRGSISEIHPTGWHTDTYDNVEGGNLYNRCHLIAHKLSGDDAVARNLITGTSYMNRKGMLPFEDRIEEYVKSTGNHVMYRVTPIFKGEELVARGVHMMAVSVEDKGEGLAFNVFCYNVQPGIEIDYATGDNKPAENMPPEAGSSEAQADEEAGAEEPEVREYVLNINTKKFHYPECDSVKLMKDKNKEFAEATRDEVMARGFDPCGNCHP
jgi:DNA-entry nuclease